MALNPKIPIITLGIFIIYKIISIIPAIPGVYIILEPILDIFLPLITLIFSIILIKQKNYKIGIPLTIISGIIFSFFLCIWGISILFLILE